MPTARSLSLPVDEDRLREVERFVEEQRLRRQGNKVLHGYPPPLLWRSKPVPVEEALALRQRTATAVPKGLILYVSTPFCLPTEPDRCGFCLFPSEVYRRRSQLEDYLGLLEKEGEIYRSAMAGTPLLGVYFGGGTANLYRPGDYSRLLGIVCRVLGEIPPVVEVTLEGIPQLFSADKLRAMQEAGINRISIGAQQLDEEMIRWSGRRQSAAQVFETIETCHRLGLPVSVDLIFGWPRQSVSGMLRDLEALVAAGVQHLTHYELNVAGRSDFALRHSGELPSREENLTLYREARAFLEGAGFRQRTAYDWEREASGETALYRFESHWHRPLRSAALGEMSGVDMWGWGFAGVSSFLGSPREPGWTYLNHTRVDEYARSLAAGSFPAERGFRYGARELRLNVLFQMLHGLEVDLEEYRRLFAADLLGEHPEVWEALVRRGWVEVAGDRLRLLEDGVFHTPLIQTLLARSQRMEAAPRP